ncbi:DUF4148 domain-containing protein [Burkholderia sp. BCCIQ04A]|uniref:DUF4148 domain-containing protein n=1 Tax=Burkholderia anthinoferrum TaxID=3090833 RepID=A0ABU5WPP5_9BURK|nr:MULTISPECIES: DUF4148 domain-containing protein [Burkholderia]MEB2503222.1 DUF4148 domain-containing protein [Burkholderia anthinoferrum]MEB2529830.1 DUF4148 domain-containing protein [Burkholderia anthinoferrum]MEB2561919.1 DUF4148 domain-containing protein [Burkholderia anthinoferrum]MEB2580960.1 DUF4148 domain-containing protein [Burkholderia anthinoferrum]MDF3096821.1 DUF4148 domain-containing protein [Burkholderia semiarida]
MNNALRFAVATAAAALLSPAFAQTDASAPAQGLTRAEVIEQLKQAYLDGELPTNDGNYPPNAATRARNRELVQATSPAWLAHVPPASQGTSQQ